MRINYCGGMESIESARMIAVLVLINLVGGS